MDNFCEGIPVKRIIPTLDRIHLAVLAAATTITLRLRSTIIGDFIDREIETEIRIKMESQTCPASMFEWSANCDAAAGRMSPTRERRSPATADMTALPTAAAFGGVGGRSEVNFVGEERKKVASSSSSDNRVKIHFSH